MNRTRFLNRFQARRRFATSLSFLLLVFHASVSLGQEADTRSYDVEKEEAFAQAIEQLYSGDPSEALAATRVFKRLAVGGHVRSQHALGVIYQQGLAGSQSEPQAERWFEEAANRRYPMAMMSLAAILLGKEEAKRDYARARELLEGVLDPSAAKSLSPEEFGMLRGAKARASYLLGLFYVNAWGVEKDSAKAVQLLAVASGTGDKDASLYLAIAYAKGEEVEKDVEQAKFYFDLWDRQSSDELNRNLESTYGQSGDVGDRRNMLEASEIVSEVVSDMVYAVQTDFAREVLDEASEDFDAEFAAELLKLAVDGGYAEAKLWLGILHYRGQGVERDYGKAGTLFGEAAEEGWVLAQYNLACMIGLGQYEPSEGRGERELLKSAAGKGLYAAQARLDGDGDFGILTPDEARNICLEKADTGDARALYSLALRKSMGWLVDLEPDYSKVLALYERSAQAGYGPAQFVWGMALMSGQGVKQDPGQGLIWMRSAAFREMPEALTFLGDCYLSGLGVQPNVEEAYRYFSRAAELGFDNAKNRLAKFHYYGVLVPKNEYKAAALYLEAADEGDAEAAQNLGNCYLRGIGVRSDVKKAMDWLGVSAELGNIGACLQLAFLYQEGLMVDRDEVEIAYWQERAAEMGDKKSMKRSALNYLQGEGVPINRGKAASWIQAYLEHPEPVDVNDLYFPGEYEEHLVVRSILPLDYSALLVSADLMAQPGWSGSNAREARATYERLVRKGSQGASLRLAKLFIAEGATGKNARQAASLLKALFEKNKGANLEGKRRWAAEAAYLMSQCYADGIGVKRNGNGQLEWLSSAAQLGYPDAQYELAVHLAKGEGAAPDADRALQWFLAAARSGDSRSQLQVARLYLEGTNAALLDKTVVVTWLKALVDAGSGEARLLLKRLGVRYKESQAPAGSDEDPEEDDDTDDDSDPWAPVKVA